MSLRRFDDLKTNRQKKAFTEKTLNIFFCRTNELHQDHYVKLSIDYLQSQQIEK